MEINVDLEVFKALTERLEFEGQTHNDVIRSLLDLDSIAEESPPESSLSTGIETMLGSIDAFSRPSQKGFYSRGLFLPEGTKLRAKYKGDLFFAKITDAEWSDDNGINHQSPSAAASAITGTNVNGLRFWEAKRPQDHTWRRLEFIRNQQVHRG